MDRFSSDRRCSEQIAVAPKNQSFSRNEHTVQEKQPGKEFVTHARRLSWNVWLFPENFHASLWIFPAQNLL